MDAGCGGGGGVEVNQSAKDAGCRRRVGDDGGDATTEGCQKRERRIGRGKVTDRVPLFLPSFPPSFLICLSGIIGRRIKGLPLVKGACERVVSPSALADVKSRMRRRRLDDE